VGRVVIVSVVAASLLGVLWYARVEMPIAKPAGVATTAPAVDKDWLEHLHSQNPVEATNAAGYVERLGAAAVPEIQSTLRNPNASVANKKAALKACTILGEAAASAIPDVGAALRNTELTAEAALALSYMGIGAFNVLHDALADTSPLVRRESLRSIGKLNGRASLDADRVVPVLLERLADDDPSVRAVAATYLGIIRADAGAVDPLVECLKDEDPDVRRAAATALGEYGAAAAAALPALRKASTDRDEDVAREAGRALVKLEGK
jgi:hypothetical protein